MNETKTAIPASHPPGAESRFRTLFDQAPVGMVLIDPASGGFLEANQRLANILGLSPAALATLDWHSISQPDAGDKDENRPPRPRGEEMDDYQGKKRYLRPDGSVIWISLVATRVETGSEAGPQILAIVEDITASVEIEEKSRLSEEQFRSLFEVTGDCVWELDALGYYRYVSPIAEDYTGYSSDHFLGQSLQDLSTSGEEHLGCQPIRDFFVSRKGFAHLRHTSRHRDGCCLTLESSGILLFNSEGEFLGMRGISRDITLRQQAEKSIRASEIKYQRLFQFAPIPLALKDLNGKILLCNDQFVQTLGYTAEDIQTLDRWYEIFYPDESYRRQVVDSWEKVIEQGSDNPSSIGPIEYRMTRKDGMIRHVEISTIIQDDEQLAAFMDVTDRKHTELALRESVERLNEAQRVAHIGSWEWDMKRNQVWWSEELYRLFELIPGRDLPPSREELWGRFVHPDDQSLALAAYTQALAERRDFKIHVRLLLPTGRIKHIERIGRAEYAPDGTVILTRGTTQDITQNKLIENNLRISEERHRLLADNASDVIWTFDFHRGLTYVSPSIEKLTGYRPEEYLRLKLEDTCHPDSCLILREAIAAAYAQVRAGIPVTFQLWDFEELRKDGSSVWTEIKASGIYDNDGNFVELLGITRDISDHKRSENELRQARLVAENANRAKSEFLAHMSHEIRTPLYSLLGLAQMIDREPLSANQRDMVRRIHDAGQTLLGIISDIQDLSRIEAGKIEIDNRPFDLGALLHQLDGLLGLKARAEGLDLRIAGLLEPLGPLRGDDLRLGQVLTNLIGNAIKFAPGGEVTVRVQAIALTPSSARLRFEVRDTGMGISPEVLTALFTPFTQGDATITRRFGGTGLGLVISKRLVELMGGEIGALSQPGQGSNFWFELPFERADHTELAAPVLAEPALGVGPRLRGCAFLVVDDSETHLALMKQALEWEGAGVITATDGQQAVQILESQPQDFDAVLMDLQMPVMDGLTATRLIRDRLAPTDLPIIVLTAGVLPEQRQAAHQAGADAVMTKPVDLDQIARLLRPWVPAREPASPEASIPEPAAPAWPGPLAEAFPPIAGINRIKAAKLFHGNPELLRKFLDTFVRDYARVVEATRDDLDQGERANAARRLHKVRSAAANICAMELMQQAGMLEDALLQGETHIEAGLRVLGRQIDALIMASAPWRAVAMAEREGPAQPHPPASKV
ncbi:MAG: PAS domain S-box protein [Chromatiaceae bacterium]